MSRFLKALSGKNEGRPPLWLMRQAGRYLPEYQAIRQKHDFLELCHTPELIQEVTLQPLKRFGFDAAILFSDILVIPEAMGMKLHFDEGQGPIFDAPLSRLKDIENLKEPEPLEFVEKGIKLINEATDRPLIGFAGAPFTVASYMIEGKSSKTLRKTKRWLFEEPESFHKLLEKVKQATLAHLKLQIEAGVKAIQLFESWAPFLAPDELKAFSTDYLEAIRKELPEAIPVMFFSKGIPPKISQKNTGLSVDFTQRLIDVREKVGKEIPLQGNLDPDLLYGPKEGVERATKKLLSDMQGDKAWVFNLGHGILPKTPLENVYALRDTVYNS
ncbi:MAG: uroporphyrinogen decarboxylase [Chlamydiia bacterium]|nr:uroporphyrinogen decarboxylase [Chlamydiia bacterium]